MDQKSVLARLLFGVALILALIGAGLQVAVMFTDYEPETNYYTPGAVLPVVAAIVGAVSLICGGAAAFLADTGAMSASLFAENRVSVFFNLPGFVFPLIVLFPTVADLLSGKILPDKMSVAALIGAVLLLLAAVYTFLTSVPAIRTRCRDAVAAFGFGAILCFIPLYLCFYFDLSVEMNAPIKNALQIGCLTSALLYAEEIHFLLGKPSHRAYLFFAALALPTTAIPAFSVPIAFFTGKIDDIFAFSVALLLFCNFLLAAVHLSRLFLFPDPEKTLKSI